MKLFCRWGQIIRIPLTLKNCYLRSPLTLVPANYAIVRADRDMIINRIEVHDLTQSIFLHGSVVRRRTILDTWWPDLRDTLAHLGVCPV